MIMVIRVVITAIAVVINNSKQSYSSNVVTTKYTSSPIKKKEKNIWTGCL